MDPKRERIFNRLLILARGTRDEQEPLDDARNLNVRCEMAALILQFAGEDLGELAEQQVSGPQDTVAAIRKRIAEVAQRVNEAGAGCPQCDMFAMFYPQMAKRIELLERKVAWLNPHWGSDFQ